MESSVTSRQPLWSDGVTLIQFAWLEQNLAQKDLLHHTSAYRLKTLLKPLHEEHHSVLIVQMTGLKNCSFSIVAVITI